MVLPKSRTTPGSEISLGKNLKKRKSMPPISLKYISFLILRVLRKIMTIRLKSHKTLKSRKVNYNKTQCY